MNSSLQKALKHLTGQDEINVVSLTLLESLAARYPYFPVVHILLSKKLKETSSESYMSQVQKTALYINNPYWLHYQMSAQMPGEIILYNEKHTRNSADSLPADDVQLVPDQFHPEPEIIQEEIESGGEFLHDKPISEKSEGNNINALEGGTDFNIPDSGLPDETDTEPEDDNISADVPKPISISDEELTEDEKLLQEIAHTDKAISDNDKPDDTALQKTGSAENSLEEKVTHALEGHQAFSEEIEEKTRALINPPDPSDPASVSFEPFHTIDYFASQGIQLVLENDPQDKLGKQLKSFTQWLKHMKRLGPEDALNSVKESHLETAIQDIADTSNTPRDIVTETMATVLEKQGKTEKAIELYTKLSFLNPDKSAYFAAKIHNLKGN